MTPEAEFQRLHWFSPGFPVGGYAYSHGIEQAVETGDVKDGASLSQWIEAIITLGAARNDVIVLGEACRAQGNEARLTMLAELGLALALGAERRLETSQQGASFHALMLKTWPHPALPLLAEVELPFPVAVGMAGAAHGHALLPLARGYLQGFASGLIAAGIRLAIIGQSEAQARIAGLQRVILEVAALAKTATLDDLGGAAFRVDLMALRHETQTTRLFRS